MNIVMLAIGYAITAIGFYVWMTHTAKEVASPLALWVNDSEEASLAQAA